MTFFGSRHHPRPSVPLTVLALAAIIVIAGPLPSARAAGGTRLWVARYHDPGNGDVTAVAIAVSPDGTRVYVTGWSLLQSSHPVTVAYDAVSGAEIWVNRYEGNGFVEDLAVSPDGSMVFVTGTTHLPGSNFDYLTFAYDAGTGATIWSRRYKGSATGGTAISSDFAKALAVSPDGTRVYVTGGSTLEGSQSSSLTFAYAAATGSKIWARSYRGAQDETVFGRAIAVSPDGTHVYVTGERYGPGSGTDYATVAFDADSGSKMWVRRYNGPANGTDSPNALAVSPDGANVYVTGYSSGSGRSDYDYLTIAYDAAAGATVWTRRYNGPGNFQDFANALAVSPDGAAIYVTGSVAERDFVSSDDVTFKYDAATGATIWARGFDGLGNGTDTANALALSPDGTDVFVAGTRYDPADRSGALISAYDAAPGTKMWARLYDDAGASTIAVSPDGAHAYVTGSGYVTVAYTTG